MVSIIEPLELSMWNAIQW